MMEEYQKLKTTKNTFSLCNSYIKNTLYHFLDKDNVQHTALMKKTKFITRVNTRSLITYLKYSTSQPLFLFN